MMNLTIKLNSQTKLNGVTTQMKALDEYLPMVVFTATEPILCLIWTEKQWKVLKRLSVLMLCTPVFMFTSGSSAFLGRPCCGLSIWLSLLATFNTLFRNFKCTYCTTAPNICRRVFLIGVGTYKCPVKEQRMTFQNFIDVKYSCFTKI